MPLTVVAGTTAALDFRLTADGAAVDLTGATVELVLKDRTGTTVVTTGDVTVTTAASGEVRYTPDSADLDAAVTPHRARFKVTVSGGISYYPSGQADPWTVVPE